MEEYKCYINIYCLWIWYYNNDDRWVKKNVNRRMFFKKNLCFTILHILLLTARKLINLQIYEFPWNYEVSTIKIRKNIQIKTNY